MICLQVMIVQQPALYFHRTEGAGICGECSGPRVLLKYSGRAASYEIQSFRDKMNMNVVLDVIHDLLIPRLLSSQGVLVANRCKRKRKDDLSSPL